MSIQDAIVSAAVAKAEADVAAKADAIAASIDPHLRALIGSLFDTVAANREPVIAIVAKHAQAAIADVIGQLGKH